MSAPQATTSTTEATNILPRLCEFLSAESRVPGRMAKEERAKVQDLCGDVDRLDRAPWLPLTPGFGRVFSGFERVVSILARRTHRRHVVPKLNHAAKDRAKPRIFAADYATFDRLSIVYGGLFRGSVIVNYLLGVVAVGLTLASILPQPKFVAPSGAPLFLEFAHYAVRIELLCILIIGVIFYYGQTPHDEIAPKRPRSRWRRLVRLIAHRWHERWLEYRVLAERFRYLELMLSLSPGAAMEPPFTPAEGESERWYDRYFVWRTRSAKPAEISVHEYREQALALMLEQIGHHDANSSRRGTIARRLQLGAVVLFFSSLFLCAVDLIFESSALSCVTLSEAPIVPCDWTTFFNSNLKSLVLFGAVLAPVLAAAIHGILATTEYTKVAEASRETADRIASLTVTITTFPSSEEAARPEALKPIREAVTAFADAAINEASGWRAMLRDKNVPLV